MTLTFASSILGRVSTTCSNRSSISKCFCPPPHRSHLLLVVPIPSPKRGTHLAATSAASWEELPRSDTYQIDVGHGQQGQESIKARIDIDASVKIVWEVLTNFSKLVEVVPNLIACEELQSRNPHTKRIRQSAGLKCRWWRLQAEAVLDLQSYTRPNGDKELHFTMIEGDFKEYHGQFVIEGQESGLSSLLSFDAVIEPLESIPEMLFVHAVQIWLPFNLNGIVKKAEEIALNRSRISPFTSASLEAEVALSNPATSTSPAAWYLNGLNEAKAKRQRISSSGYRRVKPADYLGTAFVPLPANEPDFRDVLAAKEETLPKFELDEMQMKGVEVHMRKLDTKEMLHRRVVCSLRIMAPVKTVWNVLTDYDNLEKFIPNLAKSKILAQPENAPKEYKRLKQIVRKKQTYMQLQAESVLDVVEIPCKEIQFRQISGFVQVLQGKWVLKQLNTPWNETDTLLTYALELKTVNSEMPLELIEPIFEQAAVEGLPLNLTAVKQEVLRRQGKPSSDRLCQDFEALKSELLISYGNRGKYLPTRLELRRDHRSYLEKAIAAHGGPAVVSEGMGWKMKNKIRKRRGYWENFRNLEQEIMDFTMEMGLPNDTSPTKKDFNDAGRVDLRRAVEKWGGINAVMELIEIEKHEQGDDNETQNHRIQQRKMEINLRDLDE